MLRNLRSGQLARPTRESVRLQNCRWQRPHHSNVTITTTSRRRCWRTIQNFRVPNCWCRRTIPFSYKSAVLLRNIFHRQCDAYFIAIRNTIKVILTTTGKSCFVHWVYFHMSWPVVYRLLSLKMETPSTSCSFVLLLNYLYLFFRIRTIYAYLYFNRI